MTSSNAFSESPANVASPLKLNDGDGNPLLDGITAPAKFWKDMYGLNKIDLED